MRTRVRLRLFAFGIALAGAAAAAAPAPTPAPSPVLSPEAQGELRFALQLLSAQRLPEAKEAFKRADELSEGRCFSCLEGLAATELRMGDSEAAAAVARRADKAAGSPDERARAQNQLGLALAGGAGKDPKALAAAEAAYRRAIELSGGKLNATRYNLANLLLREGKLQEGLQELDAFLKNEPEGARAAQARTLRRSPGRAGELLAPDFSLETLSGGKLTLAALAGKVVLVDFWATWCGPCRLALPELKALRKEMAKEPFELVSFSADRSLSELKAFVEQNRMDWPQHWDQTGALARDFTVSSYPSYYLIDPDGVVVYTLRGWSPRTGDEMAAEVRKAVSAAKKRKPAAARP